MDEAAKALNEREEVPLSNDQNFMNKAIEAAIKGVLSNDGGPFGCVIIKDGEIIGTGNNKVTSSNDPTAHAEIMAIREACKNLDSFQLDGCIVYTSCEPCPMCFGAIYWARPQKVFYGCNKADAAEIGFDDEFIYKELDLELSKRSIPFKQINRENAVKAFKAWKEKDDKIEY